MSNDPLSASIHRALGALEAKVEAIKEKQEESQEAQKKMDEKLNTVYDTITQVRGAWALLAFVASIGAAIGALAAKFLTFTRGQ